MRDRAAEVGAELSIHTEPDHGSQCIVTVQVDGTADASAASSSLPETFLS